MTATVTSAKSEEPAADWYRLSAGEGRRLDVDPAVGLTDEEVLLWVNFAIDVLLAFGLGFDAETPGLMQRRPRPANQPVIETALGVRLVVSGLLIAIATLAVVSWAEDRHGLIVATTMGLVTTALLHIVATLEWRDPDRSVFSRATVANGRFNLLMLTALALTFLATTIPGLQRILDTADLDGQQWRVCLIAVGAYFVVAEIEEFLFRHFAKARAR
jgi:P-type Ca2+ transporter type 2C